MINNNPAGHKRIFASILLSLLACSLLFGCNHPDPDYPLNTDNTRIVETPGLNEPSDMENNPTMNSFVFSNLGFQRKGYFVDSAVGGLQYYSPSQKGITGEDGSFYYTEGEMIHFHIGNLKIGAAIGKTVITPLDLVLNIDETELTNILQLLQTLDSDGDANNGITINENVRLKATEINFPIKINDDDFTDNQDLFTFISSVSNTSNLISPEQAHRHFKETLTTLE
ncbi:MAG: hypothetical protein KUG82_13555 [Pseudomonadales bacterium]|nr:hypothetical protein [Pseudomonadales bacterium]